MTETMIELVPCEASPDCYHKPCETCKRALRSNGFPLGDHPGTVRGIISEGLCLRCRRHATTELKRLARPQKCIDCKKDLRSESQSEADFPGTVVHAAKGRCRTCHTRFRAQLAHPDRPVISSQLDARQARLKAFGKWAPLPAHFVPLPDETIQQMKRVDGRVGGYIEARRRRGVPAEGWQYYIGGDKAAR